MIKCKLAYKQHKIKHFIFISLGHGGGGGGCGGLGVLIGPLVNGTVRCLFIFVETN